MTASLKIRQAVADHYDFMIRMKLEGFQHLCESPIEVTMLEALIAFRLVHAQEYPKIAGSDAGVPWHWSIFPQHPIGKYRVDFLLIDEDYDVQVVIECDGHDFHERTKEQAMRDSFGLSSTRYYQLLNGLLDKPEATEHDPVLVGRLRRLRATRARTRRR